MENLPENIVKFLKSATYGVACSRSESMEPFSNSLSAWHYNESTGSLSCYFSQANSFNLIETLENNGDFAVSIAQMPSHETYQFKGKYINSHPCTREDLERYHNQNHEFVKLAVAKFGLPQNIAEKIFGVPSITVNIRPHSIYDQTPGPEAGKKLELQGASQ